MKITVRVPPWALGAATAERIRARILQRIRATRRMPANRDDTPVTPPPTSEDRSS